MANVSALHGLMKFLNREEWRDAFAETTHEHFFAACKDAGIDMDQLAGILDHHTAMTLWGCAFEDFLARPLSCACRGVRGVGRGGTERAVGPAGVLQEVKLLPRCRCPTP